MRDEYDGTRVPTRFSPLGTLLLAALLVAAVAFAATGQTRLGDQRPFRSCEVAQAAGVPLPLTPADPGWNPSLDGDHDGQAC